MKTRDPFARDQQRAVAELRIEQAAVAVANRCNDATSLPDAACDALQPRTIGKIPHHRMPSGEVDGIEIVRIDIGRCRSVRQQGHARGIIEPGFGRSIEVRPLECARLQRYGATQRAHQLLQIPLRSKHIPGMGQLRQPQPCGVRRSS